MASEPVDDGVCAGSAPALVARAVRLVFTGSGRTPAEVLAALEAGEPVDPREARLAQAWADAGGAHALSTGRPAAARRTRRRAAGAGPATRAPPRQPASVG